MYQKKHKNDLIHKAWGNSAITLLVFNAKFTQVLYDWLIDWLLFNVQRAIFQLYSGREHLKI